MSDKLSDGDLPCVACLASLPPNAPLPTRMIADLRKCRLCSNWLVAPPKREVPTPVETESRVPALEAEKMKDRAKIVGKDGGTAKGEMTSRNVVAAKATGSIQGRAELPSSAAVMQTSVVNATASRTALASKAVEPIVPALVVPSLSGSRTSEAAPAAPSVTPALPAAPPVATSRTMSAERFAATVTPIERSHVEAPTTTKSGVAEKFDWAAASICPAPVTPTKTRVSSADLRPLASTKNDANQKSGVRARALFSTAVVFRRQTAPKPFVPRGKGLGGRSIIVCSGCGKRTSVTNPVHKTCPKCGPEPVAGPDVERSIAQEGVVLAKDSIRSRTVLPVCDSVRSSLQAAPASSALPLSTLQTSDGVKASSKSTMPDTAKNAMATATAERPSYASVSAKAIVESQVAVTPVRGGSVLRGSCTPAAETLAGDAGERSTFKPQMQSAHAAPHVSSFEPARLHETGKPLPAMSLRAHDVAPKLVSTPAQTTISTATGMRFGTAESLPESLQPPTFVEPKNVTMNAPLSIGDIYDVAPAVVSPLAEPAIAKPVAPKRAIHVPFGGRLRGRVSFICEKCGNESPVRAVSAAGNVCDDCLPPKPVEAAVAPETHPVAVPAFSNAAPAITQLGYRATFVRPTNVSFTGPPQKSGPPTRKNG